MRSSWPRSRKMVFGSSWPEENCPNDPLIEANTDYFKNPGEPPPLWAGPAAGWGCG